jgi:hypothetical protein
VAFPQQTTSAAVATGALADFPSTILVTRTGRPYVRVVKTVGGTGPSFGSVAVLHGPPNPW